MVYEYGQHCGDENCHACGTQRYNCDELNRLDLTHDLPEERINLLEEKISEQKSFKKVDSQESMHRHDLVKAKLIGYLGLRDNYDVGSLYSKYINCLLYTSPSPRDSV